MDCLEGPVSYLSWSLMIGSVLYLWRQTQTHSEYGRYITTGVRSCSARVGWFLQEVPSFLLPLLMILLLPPKEALEPRIISGRTLLLSTFMLHYFQRSVNLLAKGVNNLWCMFSAASDGFTFVNDTIKTLVPNKEVVPVVFFLWYCHLNVLHTKNLQKTKYKSGNPTFLSFSKQLMLKCLSWWKQWQRCAAFTDPATMKSL